jgi:hypothetical protein
MRRLIALGVMAFVLVAAAAPIPPVDARCSRDSDCGVSFLTLAPGPFQCCIGCGTSTAGNTAWVASLEATCRAYVASEHVQCPSLACPSGPLHSTCDHGTCKLVTH